MSLHNAPQNVDTLIGYLKKHSHLLVVLALVGMISFSQLNYSETTVAAGETINGTVYTDEGTTPLDGTSVNKTVRLLQNGVDTGLTGEITDATGTYSIGPLGASSSGDILTLYLDDEAENGVLVTRHSGVSIAGADIYVNYLRVSHEDAGPITNANLDTADDADPGSAGNDISSIYTGGTTVTTATGTELLVRSGKTYTPGGALDLAGSLDIDGTLNAAANAVNIAGNFDNASGTFTHTAGTDLTFDGTSAQSYNQGSSAIGSDIFISNTSAPVSVTGNAIANGANNLTISTDAILALGGETINTSGTFSNEGTLRLQGNETVTNLVQDIDSGTVEYVGNGTGAASNHRIKDFGATDYYNLVINDVEVTNPDTFQAGNSLTVVNNLTITNQPLDFNIQTIDIDGNLTVAADGGITISSGTLNVAGNWTMNGSFTAGTSTVTLDGVNQVIDGNTTFNNLTKNESTDDSTDSTLTVMNNTTQIINGTLTLDGLDNDDRLNIIGAGNTGTEGTFDFQGASAGFSGDFLDITNNHATESLSDAPNITLPINPSNSVNASNTTGWFGLLVEFVNATDSVTEADTLTFNLTVSGTDTTTAGAETIEVDVTGGTATEGEDYTYTDPTTISIPAADYTTAQTIEVGLTVSDDSSLEGDETITFQLQNPSTNAVIGDVDSADGVENTNTFTITDDESAQITFSIASATTNRDEDYTPSVDVMLSLGTNSGTPAIASGQTITVQASYSGNSTATIGEDLTFTSPETLTFTDADASGATKNLTLTLTDDDTVEGDETAIFDLAFGGAGTLNGARQITIGVNPQYALTINDDDGNSTGRGGSGGGSSNRGGGSSGAGNSNEATRTNETEAITESGNETTRATDAEGTNEGRSTDDTGRTNETDRTNDTESADGGTSADSRVAEEGDNQGARETGEDTRSDSSAGGGASSPVNRVLEIVNNLRLEDFPSYLNSFETFKFEPRNEFVELFEEEPLLLDENELAREYIDAYLEQGAYDDIGRLHAHFKAVVVLTVLGAMEGYEDNTSRPDAFMNRAEVSKLALLIPSVEIAQDFSATFADTAENEWYQRYVNTGLRKGIIQGREGGLFEPGSPATRAEAFKMFANSLEISGDRTRFTPAKWKEMYANALLEEGILTEKLADPELLDEPITRGEVAELSYRIIVLSLTEK